MARLWLGPDRRVVVEDPGDPTFRRAVAVSGATIDQRPGRRIRAPARSAARRGRRGRRLADGPAPDGRHNAARPPPAAAGLGECRAARSSSRMPGPTISFSAAPRPSASRASTRTGGSSISGAFESLLHGGVRLGLRGRAGRTASTDSSPRSTPSIPAPSPVQQRALGRFLADGHLDRHIARVRRALLDRQEAVLGAIERELGWLVEVRPAAGGTRLIATIAGSGLDRSRCRPSRGRCRRRPRFARSEQAESHWPGPRGRHRLRPSRAGGAAGGDPDAGPRTRLEPGARTAAGRSRVPALPTAAAEPEFARPRPSRRAAELRVS